MLLFGMYYRPPQCVIEKHSCPKCISHKCITSDSVQTFYVRGYG